jgi:hypothetical protein
MIFLQDLICCLQINVSLSNVSFIVTLNSSSDALLPGSPILMGLIVMTHRCSVLVFKLVLLLWLLLSIDSSN